MFGDGIFGGRLKVRELMVMFIVDELIISIFIKRLGSFSNCKV